MLLKKIIVLGLAITTQTWAADCSFPAPLVMPGTNFYANASGAGDIVDPQLKRIHDSQMQPLDTFMLSASNALDLRIVSWSKAPDVDIKCISDTLIAWAGENALMVAPPNSGSSVGRAHFVVGLNLIAAKLVFRSKALDPRIADWLRTLTGAVIADYKDFRFHGHYNNVNALIGAAAATFLAISAWGTPSPLDAQIAEFETLAWHRSLAAIVSSGADEGLVLGEIQRRRNAMLYSFHYFSALLVHREARRALGREDKREEWIQLRRFARRVGSAYCGSATSFFLRAGVNISESDQTALKQAYARSSFRVIRSLAEGTIQEDLFKSCSRGRPVPHGYIDTKLGGDVRYIRPALRSTR
jgi:hypothetical protein